MGSAVPPQSRSEDAREAARRRAARRTAWVWGMYLLLAAGCFAWLYGSLSARREESWKNEIRAALTRGDDTLAAQLLSRCRREAPELAATPVIAALEAELTALQERRGRREEEFAARLAALRGMLEDGGWTKRVMALEFAEAARLAPDEPHLEALRELQLRYEALLQIRESEALRAGAQTAGQLRSALTELAQSRRAGETARSAALTRRCGGLLDKLRAAAEQYPELKPSYRALRNDFNAEQAAMRRQEEHEARRAAAWRDILRGGAPEELLDRCRSFLAGFPDAPEAAAVRRLEADLGWAALPFRAMAEEKLFALRQKEAGALALCRRSLRNMAADQQFAASVRGQFSDWAQEAERLAAEELPDFLERLFRNGGDGVLPPAPETALRTELGKIAAALDPAPPDGGRPDFRAALNRCRFVRDFLAECAASPPVFAGVLHREESGRYRLSAGGALRDHTEAWAPGEGGRLVFAGEIHGGEFFPHGAPPVPRAVFAPTGSLSSATERARRRQRAAEAGVAELPWPEFWPSDRR